MNERDKTGASTSFRDPEIDRIFQTTAAKITKHQARLELLEALEIIVREGGDVSGITVDDARIAGSLSFWLSHAEEIVQTTRPHAQDEPEKTAKELFEEYLQGVKGNSPGLLRDGICETQKTILTLAEAPIERATRSVAAQRQTAEALTRLEPRLRIPLT